jgi:hypothetical protein
MELDIFFVREKVLSKKLVVSHVPAQDQLANALTKFLTSSAWSKHPQILSTGDRIVIQFTKKF